MSTIGRAAATSALVAALLWASPARAQQSTSKKQGETGQPEQGPVVDLPQSAMQTSFDMSSYRTGAEASVAISGTGAGTPLGHGFWGVVSDPKKDCERRVKKLIERLG